VGDFNYPEIDYEGEVVAAGDTGPPTLFFNKTQEELCLFQHISDVKCKRRKQILRGFKRNPKRFYGYMRNMQTVTDNLTV